MNNKTRFKIYGALAFLILLVVAVICFYSRENISEKSHTQKAHVPTPVVSKLADAPALPTSSENIGVEAQPGDSRYDSVRGGMLEYLAKDLRLDDEEKKQLGVIYDDLHNRVCDALADAATYTMKDKGTIVIETGLPADQVSAFEKEAYARMRKLLGDKKWQFFDDLADTGLRSFLHDFGAGHRAITITGKGVEEGLDTSYQNPIPAILFTAQEDIEYEDGTTAGCTGIFTSAETLINSMGKMAIMAIDCRKNMPQ